MIAYWPSPKRWENNRVPPIKKELLLQGVENLTFEFYIAPAKKEQESSEPSQENKNGKPLEEKNTNKKTLEEQTKVEPEPKGEWRKQAWLQEYKQLPVMVKVIVTRSKGQDPLVFIYPLVNGKNHVVYE